MIRRKNGKVQCAPCGGNRLPLLANIIRVRFYPLLPGYRQRRPISSSNEVSANYALVITDFSRRS